MEAVAYQALVKGVCLPVCGEGAQEPCFPSEPHPWQQNSPLDYLVAWYLAAFLSLLGAVNCCPAEVEAPKREEPCKQKRGSSELYAQEIYSYTHAPSYIYICRCRDGDIMCILSQK